MKILLVEDDAQTRSYIAEELSARGFNVQQSGDGLDGLMRARAEHFDALVLDRMLPTMDGMSVLQKLRRNGMGTRVLMLTALGDVESRIHGMEAGADDYLGKPFALTELIARLSAITRRASAAAGTPTLLQFADLELDLMTRRAHRGGRYIHLQPREWEILEYLVRHAGELVTRAMLLEHVWGFHSSPQTSLVETRICRLRDKVDRDPCEARLLHTVRGEGYMLSENVLF